MTGGLMQLVAYGAQDVHLTGNPQITYFKAVHKRHTNFSVEPIEQTFNGTPTFNKLGGTNYEDNGTSSNILQIECVDDATNATFFYSLATFASDASDI